MGIVPTKATAERPTMFQRIRSMLGLKRSRADCNCDDDDDDDVLPVHKLPRVDPADVPESYDPIAESLAAI